MVIGTPGQAVACAGLAAEHVVYRLPEGARHAVVAAAGDARRAHHGVLERAPQLTEERVGRQHLGVVVQRRQGRVVGGADGALLLLFGAGEKAHQVRRLGRVARIPRHRQLPAAQRAAGLALDLQIYLASLS